MLYGACRRAALAMGYTEESEAGSSLKAAGFWKVKTLAARKNWADSSVALRPIRNAAARAGVIRGLWEWSCTTNP
jgi:hypothetical protein